jgi:hypothetical protein
MWGADGDFLKTNGETGSRPTRLLFDHKVGLPTRGHYFFVVFLILHAQ